MLDEQKKICAHSIFAIEQIIDRVNISLNNCSEDSYVTRNEIRANINNYSWIKNQIELTVQKDSTTVDLEKTILDYGRDAEAEFSDRSCGLEYIADADVAEGQYNQTIHAMNSIINALKQAGFEVITGINRIVPDEYFCQDYNDDPDLSDLDDSEQMDDFYADPQTGKVVEILSDGDLKVVGGELDQKKFIGICVDEKNNRWIIALVDEVTMQSLISSELDLRDAFIQPWSIVLTGNFACELGSVSLQKCQYEYESLLPVSGTKTLSNTYAFR